MIAHDRLVLGVMFAVVGRERHGTETTWADRIPTLAQAQRAQAHLAANDIATHIEIDTHWSSPLGDLDVDWEAGMSHLIDLGYSRRDGHFHPTCSCGGWTGTETRWGSAATADANVHLAAAGQPTIPTEREVWARRYLRGSGSHGGAA